MADREKVIKAIEHCVDVPEYNGCEECSYGGQTVVICTNLLADALELLKEQEPKLIKIDGGSVFCPSCGNELFTYPPQKFCDECGQAVKWDA